MMMAGISLEAEEKHGLFGAIMIGLGGAIGFEIFVLLDYAYFHLAGPSMICALLLCGIISLLTMFSYGELSAALPLVGGEYTYTKAAFGGLIAFMAGCLRWLSSVFAAALAAIVFVQQLSRFFSILLPVAQNFVLANTPLIAAVVVILLGILGVRGSKEITTLIVIAFLAIFAIFLITGLWHNPSSTEVMPRLTFQGLSGVFAATAYTFTMFVGIRALVAGAPEIKQPEKNVPRAIFFSMILLTVVYCSVAYVAVGVIPVTDSHDSLLLNSAAERIMGDLGGVLFAVAGMVATISSLSTAIMVQSSIVRGMSRDGYLPKALLKIHKRFGTPHVAVAANSFFIMLFSIGAAVEFLGYAASFASILVFALVNLSVIKLREKRPHLNRPFKAPFYPLTPLIGVAMSLMLLGFPVFLRDVNAESAITTSLGLMALVLASYHIRMVGLHRLRVALGGISLGIGFFVALFACLIEMGFKPLILPLFPPYALVFVSVVSVLAGILNIVVGIRKLF